MTRSKNDGFCVLIVTSDTQQASSVITQLKSAFKRLPIFSEVRPQLKDALLVLKESEFDLVLVSADFTGAGIISFILDVRKMAGGLPLGILGQVRDRKFELDVPMFEMPPVSWRDFIAFAQQTIPDEMQIRNGLTLVDNEISVAVKAEASRFRIQSEARLAEAVTTVSVHAGSGSHAAKFESGSRRAVVREVNLAQESSQWDSSQKARFEFYGTSRFEKIMAFFFVGLFAISQIEAISFKFYLLQQLQIFFGVIAATICFGLVIGQVLKGAISKVTRVHTK